MVDYQDNTIDLSHLSDEVVPTKFNFLNIGNPTPKPSPQVQSILITPKKGGKPFKKTWTRNPAQKDMLALREEARRQAWRQELPTPVFPEGAVVVKAWFCRRPNNTHFINGDRAGPTKAGVVGSTEQQVLVRNGTCHDTRP